MREVLEDIEADGEARPMHLLAEGAFSSSSQGSDGPKDLDSYCAGKDGGDRVNMRNVGDKVMADWQNFGPYYPGKITHANTDGTFAIDYDDGFHEDHVRKSNIKVSDTDQKEAYVKTVANDAACKFKGLVEKLKPKVEALKDKMRMVCTNQRAQIGAINGQVPPAPPSLEAAEDFELATASNTANGGGAEGAGTGTSGKTGSGGAATSDQGAKGSDSGSGSDQKNDGGNSGKTPAAIKSSSSGSQITDDSQVIGTLPGSGGATGSAPAPALPDGIQPAGAPAAPSEPTMTGDEAKKLEALRALIREKESYVEELKKRQNENAVRLQKLFSDDGAAPTQPGIKTVDDLLKEYKGRIADLDDEIERRKKNIKEQEMELSRLGAGDDSIAEVEKDAAAIESEVSAAWAEMLKLDVEGKLDPDLKHILKGIMKPLVPIRQQLTVLRSLEDKAADAVSRENDAAKLAAEEARRKALAAGLSAKAAAEKAENAALEVAAASTGRITAARMAILDEAQVMSDDVRKASTDVVELDIGLHPHGAKWWRFRYEHAYIEAWLMVWISLLMLLWRKVVQEIKKTLQIWAEPKPEEIQNDEFIIALGDFTGRDDGSMYLVWLTCLSEMMLTCILVFITVWVICKTTLIDIIPFLVSAPGFHMPNSGDQYRRLLVDLSSIYFFAILMYFILVFPIAGHATSLTHKLSKGFDVATPRPEAGVVTLGHIASAVSQADLKGRLGNRTWFAEAMKNEIDSTHIPQAKELKETVDTLYNGDWGKFPMPRYLVMNVHDHTQEFFEFAWYLWLPIVICYLCFAGFHRFLFMGYLRIMMAFTVIALLLIIAIGMYTVRKSEAFHVKKSGDHHVKIKNEEGQHLHKRMNTEFYILKSLQFVMFFQLYGVARMIGQPWMWELHFWPVLGLTVFALVWGILFIMFVAPVIPSFVAVMAVPPYVNKDNVKLMLHTVRVDQQEKEKSGIA
jgi:hypothetical protein